MRTDDATPRPATRRIGLALPLAACMIAFMPAWGLAQDRPDATPDRSPPAERSAPTGEQPEGLDSVQAVLAALERAGSRIATFTSGIRYTTIADLGGALTQRNGQIAYASEPAREGQGPPRRRFAVHFSTLRRGDRYFDDIRARQAIAFDGRWFWERLDAERQINKHEIVPPGQTTDPFQLGNGPFPPLPIGHRAQDILDRYRVELVPWDQGLTPDPDLDPRYPDEKLQIDMAQALMDFARGSVQLRLVPRADDARFREIRLWYRPDAQGVLLPRMSRTVDATTGNVFIVQLMHPLTINEPPREDLLTITPTDQDPNNPWSIIEHRLSDQPDAQSQGSAPAGTTRTDTPERP